MSIFHQSLWNLAKKKFCWSETRLVFSLPMDIVPSHLLRTARMVLLLPILLLPLARTFFFFNHTGNQSALTPSYPPRRLAQKN